DRTQVSSDVPPGGKRAQQERSGAMLFEMNWRAPQPKEHETETGEAASNITRGPTSRRNSRLSALRGKVSATDLRPLDHLRQAGPGSLGELPPEFVDVLRETPERMSSLRGLVTPEDLKDLGSARAPESEGMEMATQAQSSIASSERTESS